LSQNSVVQLVVLGSEIPSGMWA